MNSSLTGSLMGHRFKRINGSSTHSLHPIFLSQPILTAENLLQYFSTSKKNRATKSTAIAAAAFFAKMKSHFTHVV